MLYVMFRNIKNKTYNFWRIDTFFSKNKYMNVKIIENGGDAIVVDTNVADEFSANNMAEEAVKKFSKIITYSKQCL